MKARFVAVMSLLLFLAFSSLSFSDHVECATCEELAGAPQAGLFVLVRDTDPANQYVDIVAYYEDLTASPIRQPLNNSIIVIELINNTHQKTLKKVYTDQEGKASFRFNEWNDSCITFKAMYCPYCIPTDIECEGFQQCLDFGHIQTSADKSDDIDDAAGETRPDPLSDAKFIPQLATASWCPPPTGIATTPALCFPLILLFSLLSGALYLTGRNPFAGFNIGGMRIGSHIRYQARGRGYSFSVMQLAAAAVSIGQLGVGIGRQGLGGFAKKEHKAVMARGFYGVKGMVSGVRGGLQAVSKARAANASGRTVVKGKSVSSTSGGPQSSGSVMTASGMQSLASGGGSSSIGGQLFSGSFLQALGRIAVFIAVQLPVFRALDALVNEATWDSRTERGRSLYDVLFSVRDPRVCDVVATMREIVRPDGSHRVPLGDRPEDFVEVVRAERSAGGSMTLTIRDRAAMGTEGGTYTVSVAADGRVTGVSFTMPDLGQVSIRPTSDGSLNVTVTSVRPGTTEATQRTVERGSPEMLRILDAYGQVPITFSVGSNASQFVGNYDATRTTVAYLASVGAEAARLDALRSGDRAMEAIRSDPASAAALDRAREEAAREDVSLALGVVPGAEAPEGTLDGIPSRRSSEVGELGAYEVAAERLNAADRAAGIDVGRVGQGEVIVNFTTLTSSSQGAQHLASDVGLSERDTRVAAEHLPGILGGMTPSEMARMDPETLQARVGQALEARGVSQTDASRIAESIAPRVSELSQDFQAALGRQGFNPNFFNNLGDLNRCAAASSTGGLMNEEVRPNEPPRALEFLASRPDLISTLPPSVAEPVREHLFLEQQARTFGRIADYEQPPQLGGGTSQGMDRITEIGRQLGQVNDQNNGRLESAAYHEVDRVGQLPRVPDYEASTGRRDAGLNYYLVEERTGYVDPDSRILVQYNQSDLSAQSDRGMRDLRESLDASGPIDIGTARSIVASEYERSREMERAARAAGDTDATLLFSSRADGCANALGRINELANSEAGRQRRGSDQQATDIVAAISPPGMSTEYGEAVVRTRENLGSIYRGERPPPSRAPPRPPVGDFPTPPPGTGGAPGSPPDRSGDSRVA
ncbi:MAG: hypothetical protein AB1324_07890 [Candidatus Micrarchaeota archaeon]